MKQNLLTKAQFQQLLKNGIASVPEEKDHKPVVFLFSSHGLATLLVNELLPEDEEVAFGLIDRGDGAVVSGYVALSDLEGMRDIYGLGIERDKTFIAHHPLSAYFGFCQNSKIGLRDCVKALSKYDVDTTNICSHVPRPKRDMIRAQIAVDARNLGLGRLYVADGAAQALQEAGTLMQLRFASFVVINLRRDLHPQECAHAGRTSA